MDLVVVTSTTPIYLKTVTVVLIGCLDKGGRWVPSPGGRHPVNLRLPEGRSRWVLVLRPLAAVRCFDIFHPFHRHIFFSSPFCRMLLRSKNSKSTAPLTLISMPRCVLHCQGFSASFLQLHLPLWSSPASTLVPSGSSRHPDCSPLQPICLWLGWEWERVASVGFVFIFKIHADSGKVGCFS